MNTIKVVKLFDNPVLLAPEKGEELCARIKAAIQRFGSAKVDFNGYKIKSEESYEYVEISSISPSSGEIET
ncbi:MAG: hypothetical protein JRN15_19885, partial [Nitrososphaerota archaeon]|nr:hypothetical protein [Nitrososphaerota archaeon]